MKKKLLIGALLMGSMITASAQTTIWSDDFNDEDISDWTLIDADGDTNNWGDQFEILNQQQQPVTGKGLISRSWMTVALTPDNWAITPAINLSQAQGTITLNWKVQAAAAEWDEENYTVYAATSNSAAAFTASPVQFNEIYPGTGAGEIFNRTLDLSSFAGEETVYIAFRHHDTVDMDFLYIDDVVVTAETLSVNNHLASQFSVFPNPATNVININNADNILVNGVEIIDINGRTVKSAKFDGVSNAQINISDLATGMYMMNIASDKGTTTKKIVKN